ncbi:MAG: ABC-2 family transporter protein [Patescibacteria group bacterium]
MKYLRIYNVLLKNAVSYEAQYRGDTWLKLFVNVIWIGMLATIIEVIFRQTPAIGGWEKPEVYLLTILWVIADEWYTALFKGNIWDIPNVITDGKLDVLLTKPAHVLFLVMTKIIYLHSFYRFLTQLAVLGLFLLKFDVTVSLWHIPFAILLLVCGIIINCAVALVLNTLSFWFLRISNINDAWESIAMIGRYPLSVLPKTMKILTLTAVPIAFQSYLPTSMLLGRLPWFGAVYAVLFTGIISCVAVAFWNFAIRRYASASS